MTEFGSSTVIASALEARIDELQFLLAGVVQATGPDVLAGGRITESLEELITASRSEIASIVAELEAYSSSAAVALTEREETLQRIELKPL
jgi:hypothetical protein